MTPDTYEVCVNVKDAGGKIVTQIKTVTIQPQQVGSFQIAVFRAGFKDTYTVGEMVPLAARAEDGEGPYRYRFYVVRSYGATVVLRNYAYSNIFRWNPVTPDTYKVCVNVKDAGGKVVTQVKTVTVRPKQ